MTVYLVGAGPGDPDLVTVRGAGLLARADVVIVDRLVDRRLLDLVPTTAEVIHAGKHGHDASVSTTQESINEMLVDRGRRHNVVVRLKGGDPFLLGRGGEELAALAEAGIEAEVVPGVSSALAVPALLGVPVTHRGVSQAVTIVSGHNGVNGDVDWSAHARSGATLVLLMAVASRGPIAEALMAAGMDPATEVMGVEWGSTPAQREVHTDLAHLSRVEIGAPAVIVVGHVAALAPGRPVGGDR
jgi:uroporphyrin-III C-methyltransferase